MSGDDTPPTRWQQLSGGRSGADYAARFADLEAGGTDVHGEATFCAGLLAPGARVLDAGCGTGRVAIRLAQQGFDVVGVDVDASMLAAARDSAPDLPWFEADLADLVGDALGGATDFDLVVLAGNVVPLLEPGTCDRTVRSLADLLAPGGRLVAGFGLDRAHLPRGCPVTPLAEYDAAVSAAGLTGVERYATWDRELFEPEQGYVVTVDALTSIGA